MGFIESKPLLRNISIPIWTWKGGYQESVFTNWYWFWVGTFTKAGFPSNQVWFIQPYCTNHNIRTILYIHKLWTLQLLWKIWMSVLKKSGYSTHLVGKWHLGQSEPNFHPLNRGFDTFYGFMGAEMQYKKHTMGIFLNSVRYQTLTLNESFRIPTVKLKIPGKAFLKSESRTSVTFKL